MIIRTLLLALSLCLIGVQLASAQIQPIELSNMKIYGQDHGFPNGLWTDSTFARYPQTFDDFDDNGIDDLLIGEYGYTIVLFNEDGTVKGMLPGHVEIEGVVGPGDINEDGIPDLAYLKSGKVYMGFLDEDGWITEERELGLDEDGSGIGAGFSPDKLYRVGDVNGDGFVDVGVSLQSSTSEDLKDRRFGVVYVDVNANQNRKGDQFVAWNKGNWITGDPTDGKQIDVAVHVVDLEEPADGIKDFILLSSIQNDEIHTNYIDFNGDGSANHYLSSEALGLPVDPSSISFKIFDEPNPDSGDFRFRSIGFGNTLIDLSKEDKEIVNVIAQEVMAIEGNGKGDATQIGDITGDSVRDYVSGKSRTFYNDGDNAYIQTWSENNSRGPLVNSFQNGGWKILRPGDQYGAAISVEPLRIQDNTDNVYQLVGVRARHDGRGSFMWHHNWGESGVIGSVGTYYQAQTPSFSLTPRDLFGSAVDVVQGFIGAPGRYEDRGAIFKIPGVIPDPRRAAREVVTENTFELDLGAQLIDELSTDDEFGSSVESFFGETHPYDIAVGAIEKNKSGGKNTGAVYLLDIEEEDVVGFKEIGRDTPVLGAMLDDIDHFGSALAVLGDVDGNGFDDLAVGARVDDDGGHDRGAVYILFMKTGAEIERIQKISATQGGFHGTLPNSAFFGEAVARLGDINQDSIPDMAVGAPRMGKGAVWILTLDTDGTVKTTSLINESFSEIELDEGALFGGAVDANYCEVLADPIRGKFCRPSPQLWVSARGNNEHRGTVWAFDIQFVGDPLPVELTAFAGLSDGGAVSLTWEVASELNNAGFQVQRSRSREERFQTIGFVEGNGTGDAASFSYVDANPPAETPLYYRLKQIDFDGGFSYTKIVEIAPIRLQEVMLYSNYPNPFNPVTTLSFTLPKSDKVTLIVYDVMGREMSRLVDETLPAGYFEYTFDGQERSSGMYMYRLVTPVQTISKKMLLLK